MATEVYPEIFQVMNELDDQDVHWEYGNMEVYFRREQYPERKGSLEIKGRKLKASFMYTEKLFAINQGVVEEICPIFSRQIRNSSDYMDLCEASILVLKNLRERKLRITNILDTIDSLPTVLCRSVLIEKFKK